MAAPCPLIATRSSPGAYAEVPPPSCCGKCHASVVLLEALDAAELLEEDVELDVLEMLLLEVLLIEVLDVVLLVDELAELDVALELLGVPPELDPPPPQADNSAAKVISHKEYLLIIMSPCIPAAAESFLNLFV